MKIDRTQLIKVDVQHNKPGKDSGNVQNSEDGEWWGGDLLDMLGKQLVSDAISKRWRVDTGGLFGADNVATSSGANKGADLNSPECLQLNWCNCTWPGFLNQTSSELILDV